MRSRDAARPAAACSTPNGAATATPIPAPADFGLEEMIADVLAVADAAGVEQFIPCAASHSGFVAIELRGAFRSASPASSTSTGT